MPSNAPSSDSKSVTFQLTGLVGRIILDLPGKPVNVLSQHVIADLEQAVEQAEQSQAKFITIESGKPGVFVAGADIFELQSLSRGDLLAYLKKGQELFSRIENLKAPTFAIVAGAALGGGLELALSCDHIFCVNDRKTQLGLPEVTLGLIPGWGGCVRLPLRIGAEPAAAAITTGKPFKPAEAQAAGLATMVESVEQANSMMADLGKRDDALPPDASVLDAMLERLGGDAANTPAAHRAVQVIQTGLREGKQAGFDAEREGLADLRDSTAGQNLLRAFTMRQDAKKKALTAAGGTAKEVQTIGVIGGGTMGAGIAYATLSAGYDVLLAEVDEAAAEAAGKRVRGLFERDLAKGRTTEDKLTETLDRLTLTEFGAGDHALDHCQLIIEAASENLKVKQELFKLLAESAPHAVLATNTSSLSVSDLAAASGRPADVVGLHFFNPVPQMPLVEVVKHDAANPDAVATAVSVALACRKTPVICNDAPGFIVNRVLFPYLAEAVRAINEGGDIEAIDANVTDWGMPMGPVALMDTIGLDVTSMIFDELKPHLGDRVVDSEPLRQCVAEGKLGRKSGEGFYIYPKDRSAPTTNEDVLSKFRDAVDDHVDVSAERFILLMTNEAARVLAEGVVDSPDAIDLATLLGLGLAPWRGGAHRHLHDLGEDEFTRELESLAERHGERFEPAESV